MLEIGKVYRCSSKNKDPMAEEVDGLPNFFRETAVPCAGTQFEVQRGIHVFSKVNGPDGEKRIPLIFITSSPYKAGTEDTPWKDSFDTNHGRIKYYGDNKTSERDPNKAPGNKALLQLMNVYQSPEQDVRASQGVPLLYFERVTVDGRKKGNLKFQGFGIVEGAQLVTQSKQNANSGKKEYFLNYLYNLSVFSLKEENEQFDFVKWIEARYNPELTAEQTNLYSPHSWREWVKNGSWDSAVFRREINDIEIIEYFNQIPSPGSENYRLLGNIYDYYSSKTRICEFRTLAIEVLRKMFEDNGVSCMPGRLTLGTDDGDDSFALRVDIGMESLSRMRVIVYGEASCVPPTKMITFETVEPIIKKLKPGWKGVFVTTSYFSESLQKRMAEQGWPLILVNGKKISQIVRDELFQQKMSLEDYCSLLETRTVSTEIIPLQNE